MGRTVVDGRERLTMTPRRETATFSAARADAIVRRRLGREPARATLAQRNVARWVRLWPDLDWRLYVDTYSAACEDDVRAPAGR